MGLDRIKRPAMPYFLVWYFELRRWPGSLLWGGGLLDQPDWIWQMIDLAGSVYNDTKVANAEAIKGMGGPITRNL